LFQVNMRWSNGCSRPAMQAKGLLSNEKCMGEVSIVHGAYLDIDYRILTTEYRKQPANEVERKVLVGSS
jgi:hypothetical protein